MKAQLCPTLCDLMDYRLPGFSVHGILQVRILDWVAVPFSRGSSQPSNQTRVSCTASGFFTSLATRDSPKITQAGLYICVISKRRNNTFKCIENPILNVVSEKGYYGKYWALIWGFLKKNLHAVKSTGVQFEKFDKCVLLWNHHPSQG